MARKCAGMASAIPGAKTHWGLQDRSVMSPLRTSSNASSLLSKVQPTLASTHAKLTTHVPDLFNHPMGEHRQSIQSETPQSLLRSIKLRYMPALLHSQDGQMERRERFASAERGHLALLLPWLRVCVNQTPKKGGKL